MSMMSPPGAKPTEVGEVVASFKDYEAAAKAVSKLIASDVSARDIAIVGLSLRSIEKVTGKLGYATAARSGAVNGLLLGLMFAAIFVLTQADVPIQMFVGVMFVGIAFGMILSLISYAVVRRRRDFASVMQVVADHYDVTVLPDSLAKARQVLGAAAATPAARPAAVTAQDLIDAEPPRYGERVVPAAAPVEQHDGAVPPPTVPETPAPDADLPVAPAAPDAPDAGETPDAVDEGPRA